MQSAPCLERSLSRVRPQHCLRLALQSRACPKPKPVNMSQDKNKVHEWQCRSRGLLPSETRADSHEPASSGSVLVPSNSGTHMFLGRPPLLLQYRPHNCVQAELAEQRLDSMGQLRPNDGMTILSILFCTCACPCMYNMYICTLYTCMYMSG